MRAMFMLIVLGLAGYSLGVKNHANTCLINQGGLLRSLGKSQSAASVTRIAAFCGSSSAGGGGLINGQSSSAQAAYSNDVLPILSGHSIARGAIEGGYSRGEKGRAEGETSESLGKFCEGRWADPAVCPGESLSECTQRGAIPKSCSSTSWVAGRERPSVCAPSGSHCRRPDCKLHGLPLFRRGGTRSQAAHSEWCETYMAKSEDHGAEGPAAVTSSSSRMAPAEPRKIPIAKTMDHDSSCMLNPDHLGGKLDEPSHRFGFPLLPSPRSGNRLDMGAAHPASSRSRGAGAVDAHPPPPVGGRQCKQNRGVGRNTAPGRRGSLGLAGSSPEQGSFFRTAKQQVARQDCLLHASPMDSKAEISSGCHRVRRALRALSAEARRSIRGPGRESSQHRISKKAGGLEVGRQRRKVRKVRQDQRATQPPLPPAPPPGAGVSQPLARHAFRRLLKKCLKEHANRDQLFDETAPPQFFLEIFSGSASLSKAIRNKGHLAVSWDMCDDTSLDLTIRKNRRFLIGLIQIRLFWGIHLGTPCTSFSRARRGNPPPLRNNQNILGLPNLSDKDQSIVDNGNTFMRFSFEVLQICHR